MAENYPVYDDIPEDVPENWADRDNPDPLDMGMGIKTTIPEDFGRQNYDFIQEQIKKKGVVGKGWDIEGSYVFFESNSDEQGCVALLSADNPLDDKRNPIYKIYEYRKKKNSESGKQNVKWNDLHFLGEAVAFKRKKYKKNERYGFAVDKFISVEQIDIAGFDASTLIKIANIIKEMGSIPETLRIGRNGLPKRNSKYSRFKLDQPIERNNTWYMRLYRDHIYSSSTLYAMVNVIRQWSN